MREYIGKVLKVVATGFPGPVEGLMVDDRPNQIGLMGKDKKVTHIAKSHISGYTSMDGEPKDWVPFTVLCCSDEAGGCSGVQYAVEGAGFKRADFEAFMGPCPCGGPECNFASKGELRTVDGELLRAMLAGSMFGGYPEKKEKRRGDTGNSGKAGSKAGAGKAGGAAGRSGAPEAGAGGQAEV